jgi:hypothetical protein
VCIIIIISHSHRQSQRSAFVGPLTSSCLLERPPAARQKSSLLPHTSTHFESLDFDVSSGISCCLPGLPSSTHCRIPSHLPNSLHSPFLSLSTVHRARSLVEPLPSDDPAVLSTHLHLHLQLQARGRANCSALWFLPWNDRPKRHTRSYTPFNVQPNPVRLTKNRGRLSDDTCAPEYSPHETSDFALHIYVLSEPCQQILQPASRTGKMENLCPRYTNGKTMTTLRGQRHRVLSGPHRQDPTSLVPGQTTLLQ